MRIPFGRAKHTPPFPPFSLFFHCPFHTAGSSMGPGAPVATPGGVSYTPFTDDVPFMLTIRPKWPSAWPRDFPPPNSLQTPEWKSMWTIPVETRYLIFYPPVFPGHSFLYFVFLPVGRQAKIRCSRVDTATLRFLISGPSCGFFFCPIRIFDRDSLGRSSIPFSFFEFSKQLITASGS